MDPKKILIVPKLSMVLADMHRYVIDYETLLEKYHQEMKSASYLIEHHRNQIRSLEVLRNVLPEATWLSREQFNAMEAEKADLIISAGGDDHLKYLSHYVKDTPIIGLNSDPKKSVGALLESDIEETVRKLLDDDFQIHKETRITARIGIETYVNALSLYNLMMNNPDDNCRFIILDNGKHEVISISTGIQFYNGNATEDWSKGAGKYLGDRRTIFRPTERRIGYIIREPHDDYAHNHGVLEEGEVLIIRCEKDNNRISPDGIKEHYKLTNRGEEVFFSISDQPLHRVRLTP
ncbi:MAG: hypothetical protein GXP63_06025 [DPANN group archaeon]|nr:hypothetical protein [DPANN group archaeon]